MIVSIVPVPSFPNQANQLSLYNFSITPGVTLMATYRLLCSGNAVSVEGYVTLTSGQYSNWNGTTDDLTYLPYCFSTNIGLTYITGG